MKRNNIILFVVTISIFLSPLIISTKIKADVTEQPNITFRCLTFNFSFIENNLNELNNTSIGVSFLNDRENSGRFYLLFRDNLTYLQIILEKSEGSSCGKMTFYSPYYYDVSISSYHYNFSNITEEFLIKATEPDITNALNYIKENILTSDYNDFYSFHPSTAYGELDWLDNLEEIDENWYLASHSFKPYSQPIFDSITIPLMLLALISFVSSGLFALMYKKHKKKRYLIGVIIGLILGIFFLFLIYSWITAPIYT